MPPMQCHIRGPVCFGKVLLGSLGRDVINTVARRTEVGQQMKNVVIQILIATVAGVLSAIIWAGLQAPVRPHDRPELLRVQMLVCQNEKTALLASQRPFLRITRFSADMCLSDNFISYGQIT